MGSSVQACALLGSEPRQGGDSAKSHDDADLGAVVIGWTVAAVPELARSEVVTFAAGPVAVTWFETRWSVDALVALMAMRSAGPAVAWLVLPEAAAAPTLLGYDVCLIALAVVLTTRLLRSPSADVTDFVVGLNIARRPRAFATPWPVRSGPGCREKPPALHTAAIPRSGAVPVPSVRWSRDLWPLRHGHLWRSLER